MILETESLLKMSSIYFLVVLRHIILISLFDLLTILGLEAVKWRRISRVKLFSEYIIVEGKSGRRAVKLGSQARKILDKNPMWDYTANYVQLTWSRNRKRLGLKDVRMHDLEERLDIISSNKVGQYMR